MRIKIKGPAPDEKIVKQLKSVQDNMKSGRKKVNMSNKDLFNDLKGVFEKDLQYVSGIDIGYDRVRDTREHDRYCDNICRCSRLENARVDEINFWELSKYLKWEVMKLGYEISEIKEYCIDRVFAINRDKILDVSNYTVGVCRGYYGEEIDGVSGDLGFMVEGLNKVMGMDDLGAVREVLLMEYGYLLFDIKAVKVMEVEYKDLKIGNGEYARRLDRDRIEEYRGMGGIIGVYREGRVIDGYHRYYGNEGAVVVKILDVS